MKSLDPQPLFSDAPFAHDYIVGSGRAREMMAWRCDAKELAGLVNSGTDFSQPWTLEETAELEAFNVDCGNGTGAALAEKLGDPRALAIVTGQQPNLLASPLYVIFKAMTAWHWAARLEAETGRPVVAIFWVASDDHDFEELRACRLWSPSHGLTELGGLVSRGGAPPDSPAFAWRLSDSAQRLMQAIKQEAPEEWKHAPTRAAIQDALKEAPDFETSFCRLAARFLAATPMLFLVPRLGSMRHRQIPVLEREVTLAGETNRVVDEAADRMESLGYHAQLRRPADALNFFYLHENVRCRVLVRTKGDRFEVVNSSGESVVGFRDADALIAELHRYPDRFSPNVVTRPVVQDAALPVAAYVGGPGEIAYLAQTRSVHKLLGVEPSAIVPRASATLLTEEADTLLGGGIDAQDLEAALARLVADDDLLGPLVDLRMALASSVNGGLREMAQTEAAQHPHLEPAFRKTRAGVERALAQLDRRLRRHFHSRGSGDEWARFMRVTNLVRPAGGAQERMLSPLSFCLTMSPEEFGTWLAAAADWESHAHQIIRLPEGAA